MSSDQLIHPFQLTLFIIKIFLLLHINSDKFAIKIQNLLTYT